MPGWDEATKEITRKFAHHGYTAICPHLFSREGQQVLNDMGWMRSFHPEVKMHDGVKPLGEIKLMKADSEAQVDHSDEIKKKYAEYFGL